MFSVPQHLDKNEDDSSKRSVVFSSLPGHHPHRAQVVASIFREAQMHRKKVNLLLYKKQVVMIDQDRLNVSVLRAKAVAT